MAAPQPSMPAPVLTQCVEVLTDYSARVDLRGLTTRPGVFVLEDEHAATLALATTANVRRAVATRLEPIDPANGPTRRIDYRRLTRSIRAVAVGSAFEADWAYLQLARQRSPGACKLALDRLQSWFVHGDPDSQFPQWIKTAHPTREGGVHMGPFPDKHAAARYMELLDDAFDLCRYHHLLVQAPHATACAYKEMGKCPAPCDGSVSMEHYRGQVRQAIEFATAPIEQYRAGLEAKLIKAARDKDESEARRCRSLLERTSAATKASFAHVDRLERFRFVAVMPSDRAAWARLFIILGGWIQPWVDTSADVAASTCAELHGQLLHFLNEPAMTNSEPSLENLSLVCWHLFRPPKARRRERGRFLRLDENLSARGLQQAIRGLGKPTDETQPAVVEQFTEGAAPE